MIYKEELERIKKELVERKADLEEEFVTLPEGRLMFTSQNGTQKYLQRVPAVGNKKKEHRYGIKRKSELLNGLVRKEYIEKAITTIDRDIDFVSTAVRKYRPCDEESIMHDFLKSHPELGNGIFKENVDEEKWKSSFDRIEGYHSENLKQVASDGTRMRSKNEVYIASRLDHYKLLYRSDCPTGIPGLYRIPDFTILRKSDNKIIYWEHMGMMDDSEYRADNKIKLEEYEQVGIVPWDNLILTYDTKDGGLRADMIEAMIQVWLI